MTGGGDRDGARIGPVTRPSSEQRELLAKTPTGPDGAVRNIFLTLLHHPALLERFNAFGGTFMRFGLISPAEREAVILRVAARTRCRYELAQHLPIARDAGLDEQAILAILEQSAGSELGDRLELLMAVTDELLAQGGIGDERWAALADCYEPPALLELVCLIGFYRMTADLLNVLAVELEDDRREPLPTGGQP